MGLCVGYFHAHINIRHQSRFQYPLGDLVRVMMSLSWTAYMYLPDYPTIDPVCRHAPLALAQGKPGSSDNNLY